MIETLLGHVFQTRPRSIERVVEGVSTAVYRIIFPRETFYLRILPEENASFAPEVFVLSHLRQKQVKVPEAIYFEHCHEILQRSVMVTTEIKGQPLSQAASLSRIVVEQVTVEAGQDLASINTLLVEGFGWIKRDQPEAISLQAEWSDQKSFALEFWEADLAYLARHVLLPSEIAQLINVITDYASWLNDTQAVLAHGDLDTTHIFHDQGKYTGIIDFGEIRAANCWYDSGHFHMRDGEALPFLLLPALLSGYRQITPLPTDVEQRIRFMSLLINVRALAKSLQKRPPDRYTQHQLAILREDLTSFS